MDETRKIIWQEIAKSEESRYCSRLHAILLACSGMSSYEISRILGYSPRAVQLWIERFNESGMDGLKEGRKTGRPSSISEKYFIRLLADIRHKPGIFGYNDEEWNCRNLSDHLKTAYNITLGVRHCRRIVRLLKEQISGEDYSST